MIPYSDIRQSIEARTTFCASLVDGALVRAQKERGLNAFIELFDDEARAAAEESDRRSIEARSRPLEGMLVGIKDNICVRRHETTAGSRILAGHRAVYDATVVQRLRAAGAVLFGRTNMDEFAMGSSGQTSAYGPTRHPFLDGFVPGGSSSGSAAAVGAGLVHAALGTDTGGSVRQPAAYTGCVGMKPTYGRVSRYGLIAFSSSCDQIGPLTATVRDNARVLSVIAGPDPQDATTARLDVPDYAAACDGGVAGLRIGLPAEYLGDDVHPDLRAHVRTVAGQLNKQGARIMDVSLPLTPVVFPAYFLIANAEAASNLARYDGVRLGARATDAEDLVDTYLQSRSAGFGREVKRRIMLGTFVQSESHVTGWHEKALRIRRKVIEEFETMFSKVDLLLSPVTPGPPFRLGERLEDPMQMYLTDVFNTAANLAGNPAIAVPTGRDEQQRPRAVQLMAAHFREDLCYRAGAIIEGIYQSGREE